MPSPRRSEEELFKGAASGSERAREIGLWRVTCAHGRCVACRGTGVLFLLGNWVVSVSWRKLGKRVRGKLNHDDRFSVVDVQSCHGIGNVPLSTRLTVRAVFWDRSFFLASGRAINPFTRLLCLNMTLQEADCHAS